MRHAVVLWDALRQSGKDAGLAFVQRRLSKERSFEMAEQHDSFMPVDGGYDRVCRGSNPSDDSNSYYIVQSGDAAVSLQTCKEACVGTPGCRGIEFRPGRCEVWVRTGGVQATAVTVGPICLRYVPFVSSAENRACRGKDQFDNNPAYYEIATADSLEACQDLCLQRNLQSPFSRCHGIEFAGNRCELWTRTEGIGASVQLNGAVCQPFAPFLLLDGVDRGCSQGDDKDSDFYTSYLNLSLPDCKALCATSAPFCKGIEFSNLHCHIWTRVSGIESTVPRTGAVCLRYGEGHGANGAGDAFDTVDGGSDRACRGMNTSDWSASYFDFIAESKSVEDCKSRCLERPQCQGIELNAYGCKVWTVSITTSIGFTGTTCLRYSPFVGVDGGVKHGCFGVDPVEITSLQFPTESVSQQCRSACADSIGCQGVEYDMPDSENQGNDDMNCRIWSSSIMGSYANVNMSCLRYEPFMAVQGGMNKACGGMVQDDAWPGYYNQHVSSLGSDLSLQECKALCTSRLDCKGIQYELRSGVKTCLVWTRRGGIQMSSDQSGSVCLRKGPHDPFEDSNAFVSLGHGTCNGIAGVFSAIPDVVLDMCKVHCMAVPGCRGLDYGPAGCRIWHSEVNMTSSDPAAECFSYKPFRDVDGGAGRDCRGSRNDDLQSAYFVELPAASVQACQDLCVLQAEGDVVGRPCKGIAYDSATQTCRLWVRTQGIGATVEMTSSICQRYEPFLDLDGGSGRACRGESDAFGASYTYNTGQVANLEHCRYLCVAAGCRGHFDEHKTAPSAVRASIFHIKSRTSQVHFALSFTDLSLNFHDKKERVDLVDHSKRTGNCLGHQGCISPIL